MASKDQRRISINITPEDEKIISFLQKRLKEKEGIVSIAMLFRKGIRSLREEEFQR